MIELGQQEKKELLQLSRQVLSRYVVKGEYFTVKEIQFAINPVLETEAAGFVTLSKHGSLRGCIGEIFASRSILEVVMERTIDAAVNDSRFVPVKESELSEIEIEISVLTPPEKIDSYSSIELAKHGIILQKAGRMALFLPQVAPEQNWNLETTLTHLALKAGLGADDWREGAQFEVFEAIVFNEKELDS